MKIMNVRKGILIIVLSVSAFAWGQDTYLNDRLTAVDDLNGSARYVGMGGAMGALGADLSVISSNPAGIGLYRKSDVGLTFGVVMPNGNGWDHNDFSTYGERLARATFDQAGLVFCLSGNGNKLKFVNLAINYQKKINYNQGFFADNDDLGGLSQMDQLAELANGNMATTSNLTGLAVMPVMPVESDYYLQKGENGKYYNSVPSDINNYTRHQTGSLQSFDINASFNVDDRVYVGATFGVDNVTYRSWSEYAEYSTAEVEGDVKSLFNYSLYNDVMIDGYGLNAKVGIIFRPIEENSLRIGVTAETPTWYRLKNSTLFDLYSEYEDVNGRQKEFYSDQVESYLEYTIRTPWKARVSIGSTVGSFLAWGVEYEFANYGKTCMGYPNWNEDDPYHSALKSYKDQTMNQLTKNTLRGQHTLKAGIEVKPIDAIALRVGYNYISSRYKDNATFDQYGYSNSVAFDYSTSTDYMTLGDVNIVTCGIGYKYNRFYLDLAYKFRAQSGNFYAFDTTGMDGSIKPVGVNLNRHQLVLGLGFKF